MLDCYKTDLFDGGSFGVIVCDFHGTTAFMIPFKLGVPVKSPISPWSADLGQNQSGEKTVGCTLPETNMALTNGWLEYNFPIC